MRVTLWKIFVSHLEAFTWGGETESQTVGIVFGRDRFCLQSRLRWHTTLDKRPDTDARLARSCVLFSSLPSSVTSLKLWDFLLLFLSPNSIFGGGCIASSKSCSRRVAPTEKGEISESDRHSAASLSACFINQLHFSSAPHYTSSSLLIFIALWASDVLITVVHGLFLSSHCGAVLFPSRHVNKLMTFILKIRHISLCATWWYVLTGKVESFNVQTMGWGWNTRNKWDQTATFSGRLFVIIEKCFNVFRIVRENRFWLIYHLETSSDAHCWVHY